jgi:uncharacterized membrane protein
VVLVPTAPIPVGGGLLFVPEAWVQEANLSVEAVTSLYVSMGVTAAQYLPAATALPAAALASHAASTPAPELGPARPSAPAATTAAPAHDG